MKKFFVVFLFLFQFFCVFAAKIPKWVNDYEIDFPKDKYIARLGTGSSIENARADALGQIAGFFKSEVLVNTAASSIMQNDGNTTTKKQEIDSTVNVVSNMSLFAVEYNSPYYYKKKKTYYIVAYIERLQGVQVIENEITILRTKYENLLTQAQNSNENFLKHKYLMNAKSVGESLSEALYMRFLFDSTKRNEYRKFVSEFSQNKDIESLNSHKLSIFVESNGDWENTITTKIIESFSNGGFIVSDNKTLSDVILKITINSNEKFSDEIYTIYPDISIALSNRDNSKIFYTYNNSWGKTAAFSVVQAQKKAFPKIAGELSEVLFSDFNKKFFE